MKIQKFANQESIAAYPRESWNQNKCEVFLQQLEIFTMKDKTIRRIK